MLSGGSRLRCAAMRATPLLLLLLAACVTPRAGGPLAVADEGPRCGSFERYDLRVRRALDEAVAALPGGELVAATQRLNQARRACARHLLGTLRDLQEARGLDGVQAELDALARVLPGEALHAMLDAEAGAQAPEVRPLLELAIATARADATEARRKRADAAAFQAATPREDPLPARDLPLDAPVDAQLRGCASRAPLAGLDCLAELLRDGQPPEALGSTADALATRRLGELPADEADRGRALAALVARLEPLRAPSLGPVRAQLEAACRRSWPVVEDALRAQHLELAAGRAAPCRAVPALAAAAQAAVDRAVERQLALAAQAGPRLHAAALHRQAAAALGGPPAQWPAPPPGRWDTSRVQCPHPVTPPDAPPGLQLRLAVRCEAVPPRAPPAQREDDPNRTFEGEADLRYQRVGGDVYCACGARVLSWPVAVRELAADQGEGPLQASQASPLGARLAEILALAERDCRALREAELAGDCARLERDEPADVEERFTRAAVLQRAWAPCFEAWFRARYRVDPPAAPAQR